MREILLRIEALERALERLRKVDVPGIEGSWTPAYEGASTAGSTTYTTQSGTYSRLGPLVIARFHLVWTAATGTGNVRITGLPYAANADVAFAVQTNNVTFANTGVQGFLTSGSTQAQLFSPVSNAAGAELTIEAAGTLRGVVVYLTDG